MIKLPNGCSCGKLTVNPKNWKQIGASTKKDWYLKYRFYDPYRKDEYPEGKQRLAKGGVNRFKDLESRREAMQELLATEMDALIDGYNPITKVMSEPVGLVYEIKPTTPLAKALNQAFERLDITRINRYVVKSALKYVIIAAEQLRFNYLEIQSIRRRHIKLILEQCKKNRKFGPQTYNHYRAYIMMVFKELLELDAIELNPVKDIPKMMIERKIRATLSRAQRVQIDEYLKVKDPNFRRYVNIFFHSGSRIAELGRLQGKDVDLVNQFFKVTVKKGKSIRQEWRPIINIAVPFWREAMSACGPEDYVFSRDVAPYKEPVWNEYVTNRWRELIKDGLGIKVDFYSLKHLNLDETAAKLDLKAASDMAGHTTPVITLRYAQGEKERQNERLKGMDNKFA